MPSWSAHRNITLAALTELGRALNEELLEHLLEGVVDPDRVPDGEVRLRLTKSGWVAASVRHAAHHGYSNELVEYYFNLSLYYLRRSEPRKAMVMLGRALHYAQDGALARRRYLVLDVHDAEEEVMNKLAEAPQRVVELCRGTVAERRRRSPRGREALCIALERSKTILRRFMEESSRPVDARTLRRRVLKIRLVKVLAALISLSLSLLGPSLAVLAVFICAVAYAYRPGTYYEAMRAGLMVVKPFGYKPAYA